MKKIVLKAHRATFAPLAQSFQALVRSIIFQQLSGASATAILNKFVALPSVKKFPSPHEVLNYSDEQFQTSGVSPQKREYLRDLARRFLDGTIEPKKFRKMSDTEIIEHLVVVKGVGVWTAHMFLIFHLGRPNVLPVGDLAIRKGFQKVFALKGEPSEKKMYALAEPYAGKYSALAKYLWSVMDEQKVIKKKLAKSHRKTTITKK